MRQHRDGVEIQHQIEVIGMGHVGGEIEHLIPPHYPDLEVAEVAGQFMQRRPRDARIPGSASIVRCEQQYGLQCITKSLRCCQRRFPLPEDQQPSSGAKFNQRGWLHLQLGQGTINSKFPGLAIDLLSGKS